MAEATRTKYRVGGMDCAACAAKIETAVRRLPGVSEAGASFTAGTLNVAHAGLPSGVIEGAVRGLGYSIAAAHRPGGTESPHAHDHDHHDHDHHDHDHHDHDHHDHDRDALLARRQARLHDHGETAHDAPNAGPWWQAPKARLVLVMAAALLAAYLVAWLVPATQSWVFILAMLVGLVPIAQRAGAGARAGTPFSIETLMTIAALGAVVINATEEAAMVVLLFLIGEWLEGLAAGRARASISGLSALVPKTALLDQAGTQREVPAESLAVGAVILVRPGDRIAADGEIVEGAGAIDEAPVTGESLPKRKGVGDAVYAGTINTDAVLRVRVTAAAADNTIARVIRLVEEAQESKAPTERFIDRFSRYYTPIILLTGALIAAVPPLLFHLDWHEWVYKGLAVLLIGCPCALVISTPAAIAAGLAAGARRGLLLKGGAVLENLRRLTLVALDKTGTLTLGKPVVTDILPLADADAARILALAAALEAGSSHPLAQAILARAGETGIEPPPATNAMALPGKGLSGTVAGQAVRLLSPAAAGDALDAAARAQAQALNDQGKTVSVLLAGETAIGLIAMRDEPRPDAAQGLAALKAMGVETLMLTGDNARTARAIAADLGIEARADLLPEDKQDVVRALQAQGKIVAKVGDGINDAPALAAADIGIAMGGGTDVALETADAAILHGRVRDIADMIGLSRATMGNIAQNIAIALGLKLVFLVTTLLGITGLWPAILADTGATVLVTANAMRLLAWKGRA